MAFIYEVSFYLDPDQLGNLQMGKSLELVLSSLRALLPDSPGYIMSRGIFSLDSIERTRVVFYSVWDQWSDLEAHRQSGLMETRVLEQFGNLREKEMTIHIYGEIDPTFP